MSRNEAPSSALSRHSQRVYDTALVRPYGLTLRLGGSQVCERDSTPVFEQHVPAHGMKSRTPPPGIAKVCRHCTTAVTARTCPGRCVQRTDCSQFGLEHGVAVSASAAFLAELRVCAAGGTEHGGNGVYHRTQCGPFVGHRTSCPCGMGDL